MTTRIFFRCAPVLFAITASLAGTTPSANAQFNAPKFLKAKPAVPKSVAAGKPFTVTIAVEIDKPYHIQSNPTKAEYIATELKLEAMKGFKAGKATYPKATEATISGDKLSVYEGKVAFKIDVTPDKSVKPGKYPLSFTLHYQGCNDKACFPPSDTQIKTVVVVAKAAK